MGVVLTYGTDSAAELTEKAKALAGEITIVY
jgi:hypothetical protein